MGIYDIVKRLSTVWFFKHVTAFARAGKTYSGDILPEDENIEKYVDAIRLTVPTVGKGKPTNCSRPYASLDKHVRRRRSAFQMWQGRLQVRRPDLEFNGAGQVLDPRGKTGKDAPLTTDIKLTERYHVYVERKNQSSFTCACDPDKVANDNHRQMKQV